MGAPLIAYECSAPEHQPAPDRPDKLTIYEGAWAYCPFDTHAAGHVWNATGGVDIATLVRRGRRAVATDAPAAVSEP
jgi:hypothetical protein